jgi:predicted helicase
MHNMAKDNLGLATTRSIDIDQFEHVLCTNEIITHHSVSMKEVNYVFPLYLYPKESQQLTNGLIESERIPNFSQNFLKALSEKLNLPQSGKYKLPNGITPEDIFHYAYAIFHSPTYRQRYGDFLKVDFPRLPVTSDVELFRDLAELGKELVAFHVLNETDAPELSVPQNTFPIEGSNQEVSREIRFVEKEEPEPSESGEIWRGKVYINKTQYFDNVPEDVWEFRIGGYQVSHKWLKDRNKRKLNLTDIYHYQKVIIALQNTIRLMEAIDERIPGFPIQ